MSVALAPSPTDVSADAPPLAHMPGTEPDVALCGAQITPGRLAPDHVDRCVVCLDLDRE